MWSKATHLALRFIHIDRQLTNLVRSSVVKGCENDFVEAFLFLSHFFFFCIICVYHIYSKYPNRQARTNSVVPDQTPQNIASDQGPHVLAIHWAVFRHISKYGHIDSTPCIFWHFSFCPVHTCIQALPYGIYPSSITPYCLFEKNK